jgi:hypothetical protein
MSILEHIATSGRLTPSTVEEFLGLQLARKASDASRVREYCAALEHFSVDQVLRAFAEAKQSGGEPTSVAFFRRLKSITKDH